jgi:Helix-turn-helix domain
MSHIESAATTAREYLSVRRTATLTDVSDKTVRRWMALPDDPLPAIRLGTGPHARIRIARRELLAWLERRRAVPAVVAIVGEIVTKATSDA